MIEMILGENKLSKSLGFGSNVSITLAPILMYISIPEYLSTEYDYLTKQTFYYYMGVSHKTTSLVDLVKGSSIRVTRIPNFVNYLYGLYVIFAPRSSQYRLDCSPAHAVLMLLRYPVVISRPELSCPSTFSTQTCCSDLCYCLAVFFCTRTRPGQTNLRTSCMSQISPVHLPS